MTNHRPWLYKVLPLVYFIMLAVVWTWPLVLRMDHEVVGWKGDNFQYLWQVGWFKQALLVEHVPPFYAPHLNYPVGWSLAYSDPSLAMSALALPITLVGGEIMGFNFATLASFVLAGWGMYLWVRSLTRGEGETGISMPGLVAGTIYACLPYWYAHYLAGHLNIGGIHVFPFYFWGLFDLLQLKGGKRSAVLAGVGFGLISLTSIYYFYITTLATALLGLLYLLFFDRGLLRKPLFWKHMLVFGLAALPLVFIGSYPYFELVGQGGLPDRDLATLRGYSAKVEDFFLPSTAHFLWGEWIGAHFNRSHWIEGTLYLGAAAGLLALVGLFGGEPQGRNRVVRILLAVLGVCFMVLALGTDLQFFNLPMVPTILANFQSWLEAKNFSLVLPGTFLIKFMPFYAKMRSWKRFSIILMVAISALAGLGSARLLDRTRIQWRPLLTALLLGAVMLDFYPAPQETFALIGPRAVDLWLAEQPGKGAVVQMPIETVIDQEYTYLTLYHGKPYVGGIFTANLPLHYQAIQPILSTFPSLESVELLQEMGVQYVVIKGDDYGDFSTIQTAMDSLGLSLLYQAEGNYVYGVPLLKEGLDPVQVRR